MKDNIIFPRGIDNTLPNSCGAPGCQQAPSLLLHREQAGRERGCRRDFGNRGILHRTSLFVLEPGCSWNPPAFGWGRNGRSRCREQIPVGDGAEASSLEAVVPELSHSSPPSPPEKHRQCSALILRRLSSAGTKEQDLCPRPFSPQHPLLHIPKFSSAGGSCSCSCSLPVH